jgi:hypothetical protein
MYKPRKKTQKTSRYQAPGQGCKLHTPETRKIIAHLVSAYTKKGVEPFLMLSTPTDTQWYGDQESYELLQLNVGIGTWGTEEGAGILYIRNVYIWKNRRPRFLSWRILTDMMRPNSEPLERNHQVPTWEIVTLNFVIVIFGGGGCCNTL